MKRLMQKLVNETLKFIEVCQMCVFAGQLDFDSYNSLTKIKLKFIKDTVEREGKIPFHDRSFDKRLNVMFLNNAAITSLNREIAGE